MYLVQGLLGLSRLAVFTFFKDDLSLDPAAVGLLISLGSMPWVRRLNDRPTAPGSPTWPSSPPRWHSATRAAGGTPPPPLAVPALAL